MSQSLKAINAFMYYFSNRTDGGFIFPTMNIYYFISLALKNGAFKSHSEL